MTRFLVALCTTLASTSFSAALYAQAYPSKPIRLIVPYAAGGPVDGVARLIAEGAKTTLGQTMVVDNKPGAGGNLGVDMLAKSPADGYTLVMGAVATHAINPALAQRGGAKVNYDALTDFAPIALAASIPNVLIVNKAFAAQHAIATFADFIRALKAQPGKFDMASGGTGSAGHLAGELLKSQASVYAVHIPYNGAAPAVASVLAGQTHFMFDNLASASTQIKAGTLLALAVTTPQRAASLPALTSVAEAGAALGLRGFDVSTWFGVFAPAGTPPAVVNALNQSIRSTLSTASNTDRLKTLGSDVAALDAVGFARFVASEHFKYAAIVKAANIRVD
jgi:tripartite-type tricarboxylate transporter receptor subunit TctC